MLLVALVAPGCADDPCRALCTTLAARIDTCRGDWDVTWEDLGATSRRSWRVACENGWDTTRSDVDAREVPPAEEACEDATSELADLECDGLRALYL